MNRTTVDRVADLCEAAAKWRIAYDNARETRDREIYAAKVMGASDRQIWAMTADATGRRQLSLSQVQRIIIQQTAIANGEAPAAGEAGAGAS